MMDNQNWLAEYVQTGSEAAFRELVTRYLDLVYSTALRLVGGDAHRAEDVTQTVFANLARVARTLPKDVKLGGWLHRDTCFTASTLMRGERRRQARERQAAEMNALQNNTEADYSLVAPVLDEAINELDEVDRTAILLRFFEQNNFRSVGAVLGSNEDAARMRVTRALGKLETFLKRRGITTTAASLGVALSANAVQAAPVGLALTISTAAALTGTTLATTATLTAPKAIAMTALQKTIVTATIAVAIALAVYQALETSRLRSQIRELQQTLANQTQTVESGQTEASNQLARLQEENNRLNRNNAELLKLRGEVNLLRRQPPALSAATPPALEITTNESSFQTYTATNHIDLAWNQTLVTGGWKTPSGDRALLLTTLTPLGDTSQIMLRVKIAEIADEYLEAIWPDGMAADSNDSKTGILEREQSDSFFKELTQSGSPRVRDLAMTTVTGRECMIQIGNKLEDSGMIGMTPKISTDGKTVNLEITSTLNFPKTTSAK